MEDQFIKTATLIGDATRASILWNLLDGRAFTATELAIAVETSAQNISMHLGKLLDADLISVEKQGRHKYYRFSNKEVAYAVEAMANLIPKPETSAKKKTENYPAIKYCRTCYDHLAGKIGVALADSLLEQKIIIEKNNTFEVTSEGEKWFSDFGVNIGDAKKQKRIFLKPCLDWSERRYHIAGSVGTLLLNKMLEQDWIRRTKDSRVIIITAKGEKEMLKSFKIIV
ncbi:transcriptional regulator [Flavobacterium piscis]|uniref:Transcriptional regulator n=1 Tax=Flavobacterium piscis TaxID=1114874 RepID=A0ABX2XEP5_9FLAO|nr:winged helix-turn-helix domain-containing protein [Flavobacterium piscis]OCB70653.1 transcriptional regulator [Flavobacterium piscis]OXG03876.1 transcriptional regulator [Flavobacterium piscis]